MWNGNCSIEYLKIQEFEILQLADLSFDTSPKLRKCDIDNSFTENKKY